MHFVRWIPASAGMTLALDDVGFAMASSRRMDSLRVA